MNISKIVSKIKIFDKRSECLDYYYNNNILYTIYKENGINNVVYVLHIDIHKYKIINMIKIGNCITGCINKNKIYVMSSNSSIYGMEFDFDNNFYTLNNETIDIKNRSDKHTLYSINEKFYLCYIKSGEFLVHDFHDNRTYSMKNASIDHEHEFSFYQPNDDIYLNMKNVLYIFNTDTKTFSFIVNDHKSDATKISKYCSIVYDKFYDYKNNTVTLLDRVPHDNYNMYLYYDIESNNIVDNLYIFNNYILVSTMGTISEIDDNNNNFVLTNGFDKFNIPKNILYKRSLFFRDMLDDVYNDELINDIGINFKFFDVLGVYYKYITTNIVDSDDDFDKLYELCIFIEDVDVEHLSNYYLHKSLSRDKEKMLNKNLNVAQSFYINNMNKQYYQMMNNISPNDGDSSGKFIKYLKKIESYNSINFYIDCLEYVVKHRYNEFDDYIY